jgi:D-alanyl-lipoteichoic acid acyltransferase DltB (MBOAT superfamily)
MFGLMHGAYLVISRTWDALLTKRFGKKRVRRLRRQLWAHALAIFITFNAVSFSFVPFQMGGSETVEIFTRLLDEFLQALHV